MIDKHDVRDTAERVSLASGDLLGFIKQVIAQGNARRLIVRKADGSPLMDIPLTAGAVVGGAMTLFIPIITAIVAITALVKQVQVEIIRQDDTGRF